MGRPKKVDVTSAIKTPAVAVAETSPVVVEVAAGCDHQLAQDFWQDTETKKFMLRDRCLRCDYVGEPVWQMEAIMRPIPPPIYSRF